MPETGSVILPGHLCVCGGGGRGGEKVRGGAAANDDDIDDDDDDYEHIDYDDFVFYCYRWL